MVAATLVLTGCGVLGPDVRPVFPVQMPETYSLYTNADPGPGLWWQSFGNAELNGLVQEALSGNFDIRTALSKVKQAQAAALKAGADLAPTLDYTGGTEKGWQQTRTDAAGTSSRQSKTFRSGLIAGYELDLWGRLNALHTAELVAFDATREDLEAAAVTVAANVTTAWIDILSARQQISILKKQINVNERMLNLQELRFINGQADTLAVSQQREAVARARALLPGLELSKQQQLNAMAVLLGRAGKGEIAISQEDLPGLIPLPEPGLPADLLASRPDVRAAGLRLKKMDWKVSAARVARLPSLNLSAATSFSSSSLDLIFSNWIATLAASISGPLFDGGSRKAEVDRARAEADQYLTDYARIVAQAVQEVEDSLATEKHQGEYIRLLEEQLAVSRLTVQDANLQYINGQDNYLDYLTAWTNVQTLERQLVSEQALLVKNRVSLYRALGGDWVQRLTPNNLLHN